MTDPSVPPHTTGIYELSEIAYTGAATGDLILTALAFAIVGMLLLLTAK